MLFDRFSVSYMSKWFLSCTRLLRATHISLVRSLFRSYRIMIRMNEIRIANEYFSKSHMCILISHSHIIHFSYQCGLKYVTSLLITSFVFQYSVGLTLSIDELIIYRLLMLTAQHGQKKWRRDKNSKFRAQLYRTMKTTHVSAKLVFYRSSQSKILVVIIEIILNRTEEETFQSNIRAQ